MIHVQSLSYSTVSQFASCSERVYYEKIERLPKRSGMSQKALFGIAIHSAVAAYFRGLLNRMTLDLETLVRVFRIRCEAWPVNDMFEGDLSMDELTAEASVLLEQFLEKAPPVNVVAVEKSMQFALTPTLDCVGQIDLLARKNGVLTVIDIKSSSKAPTPDLINKYTEQCLVCFTFFQAFYQFLDRLRLITAGFVVAAEYKVHQPKYRKVSSLGFHGLTVSSSVR